MDSSLKPTAQARFGMNLETQALVRDAPGPSPPKPLPAFIDPEHQMIATHLGSDKTFDSGIAFGRGDAGPQLFGRPVPKLDGDKWSKASRVRAAAECGSSPKNAVRAWKLPGTEAVVYQVAYHER